MTLDRETLTRLSSASGFRPATLEKVLRLGSLLDDIVRHPFLGPRLVLKGGTAINLGLGRPRRLSVDLDFNYVGAEDREAMLAERPEIEREVWQPEGLPRVRCRLAGEEELWAGKIGACLTRTLPRDLYDVAMLPERSPSLVASRRFHSLTIAYCGVLDHPLHTYGRERFERVTQDDVERMLHPMLSADDRPAATALAADAWAVLEPVLALSEPEREYVDRLQTGDLRLDLIFPADDPLRDRFERHPALRWKVENARAHARRSSPGARE